jgi:hypothetical protein
MQRKVHTQPKVIKAGLAMTVVACAGLGVWGVWFLMAKESDSLRPNESAQVAPSPRDRGAWLQGGMAAGVQAEDTRERGPSNADPSVNRGAQVLTAEEVHAAAFGAIIKRLNGTLLLEDQRELLTRLFDASEEDADKLTPEGLVARAARAKSYVEMREYLFELDRARLSLRMSASEDNQEQRAAFATAYLMAAEAVIRNPNLSLNDASEAVQRLWNDLLGMQQPPANRLMSDLTMELIRSNPGDRLGGNRDVWLRYRLDLVAASGDMVEFNRAVDEWASLDYDQRASMQSWRLRTRVTILAQSAPLEAVQRQSGTIWSGLNGLSNQQIIDIGSDWINSDGRFTGSQRETYRTVARAFLPAIDQQIERRRGQDAAALAPLVDFREQVQQRVSGY